MQRRLGGGERVMARAVLLLALGAPASELVPFLVIAAMEQNKNLYMHYFFR